ncbi:multiple organellar RNA editing factor 1, mitochondrial-like [Impatiens glandulifera]|uniref:multiple organellar RNA editing factor 1, mitochondrial-like n=1 Tax=Impatiens glandulifera TaxID=253017 RepID=UPI001FB12BE1|nr:multiple organellar RNA editing factor 1, mitochondrial-like [Impatiens glandulifera]
MALFAGRSRRALTLSYSLINHQRLSSSSIWPPIPALSTSSSFAFGPENRSLEFRQFKIPFQSRNFTSSSVSFQAARSSFRGGDNEEITEDTILFEGCDYNHWLITMDFPKDPEPTREEKIETYLQTLAKVVGSYEEAKKKMYSLSTTTYQGFQCVVTEEMSEKFKGLPGVVFVLPDSYIDPVNKEYGGDKYENGVITPRPPPFQYGRNRGRSGDQNRDYNRREGSPIRNQPGNFGNPNQERNFRQPGDYSRPQPSGGMRDHSQSSNFPGRGDSIPPFQSNNSQGGVGYPNSQGGSPSGDQRNYAPPQGGNFGPPQGGNFGPPQGGNFGPPQGGNFGPPQGGNFGPPRGANYGPQAGGAYGQAADTNYGPPRGSTYGQQQAGGNYGPPAGGNYGHGEAGNYGQGAGRNFGQPAGGNFGQQGSGYYGQANAQNYVQPGMGNNSERPGGNYGQGFSTSQVQQAGSSPPTGFVQDVQTQGDEHKLRHMEQIGNIQGDHQRNYTSTPQNVVDQGKY